MEDWEVERDQEMGKRVEGNEVEWGEEMDGVELGEEMDGVEWGEEMNEGSLELDRSGHRLWKMLCHL